jgi:formylglycine-generating enzyme required for sulfatase activity
MNYKTIIAAASTLALSVSTVSAQLPDDQKPLLITNITVNAGTVSLEWADYTGNSDGITELNLFSSSVLQDAAQWGAFKNYTDLSVGGDSFSESAEHQFYRLYGVTNNVPVCPGDPVTWLDGVDHTLKIDLTDFSVEKLPANHCVKCEGDDAKTKHLYLRYIKGGGFVMGSPDGTTANPVTGVVQPAEFGRTATAEDQKAVTLTSGFYVSVYAVTDAQYNYVMSGATTSMKPKVSISWDTIRGGAGLTTTGGVTPSSGFLYELRTKVFAKTGYTLAFDLPTEAQWEYACRAGTTGTFSDRDTIVTVALAGSTTADQNTYLKPTLGLIGWYTSNNNTTDAPNTGVKDVGLRAANPAGLYDVHGNVFEWCLDAWNGAAALTGGTNPFSNAGSNRVYRGGRAANDAVFLRSAYRNYYTPSGTNANIGFRLAAAGAPVP